MELVEKNIGLRRTKVGASGKERVRTVCHFLIRAAFWLSFFVGLHRQQ
jgi:hypothetical protein